MTLKVCKFGGTSLADAGKIMNMKAIVEADPARRYVVPSAPGKRSDDDRKITDLLYLCHETAKQMAGLDEAFSMVAERYEQIIADLGLDLDFTDALAEVKAEIVKYAQEDLGPEYAASRGEYLNGIIIANLLGYEFVDAAEVIVFSKSGKLKAEETQEAISKRLGSIEKAVVPGFYGADVNGRVRTFSRGGSDISGALVARGVGAHVYENWTDVSGLLVADPRVVKNPATIDFITYRELRELAYMGATVLHDEAIFPVREAGIPVNIRNSDRPGDEGTMIVDESQPIAHTASITGIAGKKDFSVIALEKAMMNSEKGFGRRLLSVFENHGISYEHTPSGIDTMSVVVADSELNDKVDDVMEDIRAEIKPDSLDVFPGMALIATVGRGMAYKTGMAAKVFTALAGAGVNIRMIDQGSSEINIIVGVEVGDFEKAMQAIYKAFMG